MAAADKKKYKMSKRCENKKKSPPDRIELSIFRLTAGRLSQLGHGGFQMVNRSEAGWIGRWRRQNLI